MEGVACDPRTLEHAVDRYVIFFIDFDQRERNAIQTVRIFHIELLGSAFSEQCAACLCNRFKLVDFFQSEYPLRYAKIGLKFVSARKSEGCGD